MSVPNTIDEPFPAEPTVSDPSDADSPSEYGLTVMHPQPLQAAIEKWHAKLSTDAMTDFLAGLQAAQTCKVRVGTGSSGCEIVFKVMESLIKYWQETYGISVLAELVFCCEVDDEKAE